MPNKPLLGAVKAASGGVSVVVLEVDDVELLVELLDDVLLPELPLVEPPEVLEELLVELPLLLLDVEELPDDVLEAAAA